MNKIKTDLCIIGGGSGGLALAAAAVQMGGDVVLVEGGKMGGDCLNYGCVPSKSILAAAKQAQTMRKGAPFGIAAVEPEIDFGKVQAHVRGVINTIAPHDSVERFTGLGVRVIEKMGRFTGPRSFRAGDTEIRARRFVVATGSSPAVPPIPGLDRVPFLTNETVFDLSECPERLIVIGGGPIGIEMAQAFNRLGSQVTVIEMFTVLAKDDPELTAIVRARLLEEGIQLLDGHKTEKVEPVGSDGIAVTISSVGGEKVITGSHLLVAAGRSPNVKSLDLEKANVQYDGRGIKVNERLRTSNRRIYAIGDVAGGFQFTHVAGYHAGIAVQNILLRLPAKVQTHAIPWVTYTDPELAHVGLDERMARVQYGDIKVLRRDFAENDRAQTEHKSDGMIKVLVTKKGKILGASIVGAHAGELIQPWVLAISSGLKIKHMAQMIAPYPTFGEVSKRAAGSFFVPFLTGGLVKFAVKVLQKFG